MCARHVTHTPNLNARSFILSALSAIIAIVTTAPAYAETQNDLPRRPYKLEPIVLTANGKLKACGVRVVFVTAKEKIDFSVIGFKSSSGNAFELSAVLRDRYDRPLPARSFELDTATLKSVEAFDPPTPDKDGRSSTRKVLEGITGARFIQGYMVSGGALRLTNPDGAVVTFDIPGPMPNSIRASYLNCSGDLFRPTK